MILIPVLAFALLFEPAFATEKCALSFFRGDRGTKPISPLQRIVLASAASLLKKNAACVNEVNWQNPGETLGSVDLKNERKREREFRSLFTAVTYLLASGEDQHARKVLNVLAQRTARQLTSDVDEMRRDAVFDLLTVCRALLKTGDRGLARKYAGVSYAAALSFAREQIVNGLGALASFPAAPQFIDFFRHSGETKEIELMLAELEKLWRSLATVSDEGRVWNNSALALLAIQGGLTGKAWDYLENAQEILSAQGSGKSDRLNFLMLAKIAPSAGLGETGGRYLNEFHKCAMEPEQSCLQSIWKEINATIGGEVRIFDFLGTLLWFHTSRGDREVTSLVQDFATTKLNNISEAKHRLVLLMLVIAPPGVREDKLLHIGLASKVIGQTKLSDLTVLSGVRFQAFSLVHFLLLSGGKKNTLMATSLMRNLLGTAPDEHTKGPNGLEIARAIEIASDSPAPQIRDILYAKLLVLADRYSMADREELPVFSVLEALLVAGHFEPALSLANRAIEILSGGHVDARAGLQMAGAFAQERRALPKIGETGTPSGLISASSVPIGAWGPTIQ